MAVRLAMIAAPEYGDALWGAYLIRVSQSGSFEFVLPLAAQGWGTPDCAELGRILAVLGLIVLTESWSGKIADTAR